MLFLSLFAAEGTWPDAAGGPGCALSPGIAHLAVADSGVIGASLNPGHLRCAV